MRTLISGLILVLLTACGGEPAGPGPEVAATDLFNGRDFTGWTFSLVDPAKKLADVWRVQDGAIICQGEPKGFLRTEKEHENYRLTLEWRWAPGTEGGNSGVLLHTSLAEPGRLKPWPKCLESQLWRGKAGDFVELGHTIQVPDKAKRLQDDLNLTNLTDGSEKPVGEWNTMEITCRGRAVTVKVNGDLVNEGTDCSAAKGYICLQSEGAEIHFRHLRLTPLAK